MRRQPSLCFLFSICWLGGFDGEGKVATWDLREVSSCQLVDHPLFHHCCLPLHLQIWCSQFQACGHFPASALLPPVTALGPASHQQGAVFQGHQHRQAKNGWCKQSSRMLISPLGFFKPFFQALHTSVVRLSSCLPQGPNARVLVLPNSSECWGEINLKAGGQCFSCCACSGDFCRRGLRCQTHFWAQLKSCTPWSKADFRSLTGRVCFWREGLNELQGSFCFLCSEEVPAAAVLFMI